MKRGPQQGFPMPRCTVPRPRLEVPDLQQKVPALVQESPDQPPCQTFLWTLSGVQLENTVRNTGCPGTLMPSSTVCGITSPRQVPDCCIVMVFACRMPADHCIKMLWLASLPWGVCSMLSGCQPYQSHPYSDPEHWTHTCQIRKQHPSVRGRDCRKQAASLLKPTCHIALEIQAVLSARCASYDSGNDHICLTVALLPVCCCYLVSLQNLLGVWWCTVWSLATKGQGGARTDLKPAVCTSCFLLWKKVQVTSRNWENWQSFMHRIIKVFCSFNVVLVVRCGVASVQHLQNCRPQLGEILRWDTALLCRQCVQYSKVGASREPAVILVTMKRTAFAWEIELRVPGPFQSPGSFHKICWWL